MKKYSLVLIIFLVAGFITLALILTNNSKKKSSLIKVSPAYREYVQAFSSGILSTRTSVKVRLTDDFADSLSLNNPLEETYFKISPAISGKTYWSDSRTIVFQPDEQLPQDTKFTVEFLLSKIVKVPDSLKTMVFQFQTMQQDFDITIENHKAYRGSDLTREHLYGTIHTADYAKDADIEKILTATQNSSELKITWLHEPQKRLHTFQVDSVLRSDNQETVKLKWDGSTIHAVKNGETNIEIPSLKEFKCLGIRVVPSPEQAIVVHFSDPLLHEQNLLGLFRVGKLNDLRYAIEDNELRIYMPEQDEHRDPKMKVVIESSIRNINKKELNNRS